MSRYGRVGGVRGVERPGHGIEMQKKSINKFEIALFSRNSYSLSAGDRETWRQSLLVGAILSVLWLLDMLTLHGRPCREGVGHHLHGAFGAAKPLADRREHHLLASSGCGSRPRMLPSPLPADCHVVAGIVLLSSACRPHELVQPTRHSNTLSRLSRCAMCCLDRV